MLRNKQRDDISTFASGLVIGILICVVVFVCQSIQPTKGETRDIIVGDIISVSGILSSITPSNNSNLIYLQEGNISVLGLNIGNETYFVYSKYCPNNLENLTGEYVDIEMVCVRVRTDNNYYRVFVTSKIKVLVWDENRNQLVDSEKETKSGFKGVR